MEHEFKPKEWVLVRNSDKQKWKLDIFSHYVSEDVFQYKCIGNNYMECIPYEGNESLLNAAGKNAVDELDGWKVGDKVEVQYADDDKWYDGKIVEINTERGRGFFYSVRDKCFILRRLGRRWCRADQLRKPKKKEKKPFKFGDKVQFCEDGEWHDGFFILDDGGGNTGV